MYYCFRVHHIPKEIGSSQNLLWMVAKACTSWLQTSYYVGWVSTCSNMFQPSKWFRMSSSIHRIFTVFLIFFDDKWLVLSVTLWRCNMAIEKCHLNSEFSKANLWFHIVMSTFTRGSIPLNPIKSQ